MEKMRLVASTKDRKTRFRILDIPAKERVLFLMDDDSGGKGIELPYSDVQGIISAMDESILKDRFDKHILTGEDGSENSLIDFIAIRKNAPRTMSERMAAAVRTLSPGDSLVIDMVDGARIRIEASSIIRSGPVDGADIYGFMTPDGVKAFRGEDVVDITIEGPGSAKDRAFERSHRCLLSADSRLGTTYIMQPTDSSTGSYDRFRYPHIIQPGTSLVRWILY